MTVGSLFSGIGGLELGLERAGMEVRWQVEIDPFCQKVLARHWPNVARYEDVREVGSHNLEKIDVICGGFPCQDISKAGWTRAGIRGKRSGLWSEYARIINELHPHFVLIENVAAICHVGGGLGVVLEDLASLGYDAEWEVLSAEAFGAPHLRERLFLVAYPNGERAGVLRQAGTTLREQNRHLETEIAGREEWAPRPARHSWWYPEPPVDRVVDGVTAGLDKRIRSLGNAVVPQVAEWIGRRMLEAA